MSASNQDNGGPAFPYEHKEWDQDYREWRTQYVHEGMGLRDYFAAKAMPITLATLFRRCETTGEQVESVYDIAALAAYEQADAMLKARES